MRSSAASEGYKRQVWKPFWIPKAPGIRKRVSPRVARHPFPKPKEADVPCHTRLSTHAPSATQVRNRLVGSRASVKEFILVSPGFGSSACVSRYVSQVLPQLFPAWFWHVLAFERLSLAFRAPPLPLENKHKWNHAQMIERKQLCQVALTRALYDPIRP